MLHIFSNIASIPHSYVVPSLPATLDATYVTIANRNLPYKDGKTLDLTRYSTG
jgi:hypothetical protein